MERLSQLMLTLLFLSLAFMPSHDLFATVPKIKVLIKNSTNSIQISGMDMSRQMNLDGELKRYQGARAVRFNCMLSGKKMANKKAVLFASLSSPTGEISYSGDRYSGDMHVVADTQSKTCKVVNEVSMEDYLTTLLAKEMNGRWHIEALKAQAVAARSYAYERMKNNEYRRKLGDEVVFDLESSEKDQVSGNLSDVTAKTIEAGSKTKGEVLVNKSGALVPAFYHSECIGRTLLPSQVWGNNISGYQSVACDYGSGKYKWKAQIPDDEFRTFLAWAYQRGELKNTTLKNIRLSTIMLTPDRIERLNFVVYLGDSPYRLPKALLRKYFLGTRVQSNSFVMYNSGNSIELDGRGKGHGVGMSQIGALHMAQRGFTYREILAHYYPGLTIKQVY